MKKNLSNRKLQGCFKNVQGKKNPKRSWYQKHIPDILQLLVGSAILKGTSVSANVLPPFQTAIEDKAKVALRKLKSKFLYFKEEITEKIVLLQFDPNFKSNDVVCCHPSCKNTQARAAKHCKGFQRDLYLCPHHRKQLKSCIFEAMQKGKNIS